MFKATDILRNHAAIANSRAATFPRGDEQRADYLWYAGQAESLANAIDAGKVTDDNLDTHLAKLDMIGVFSPLVGHLAV